MNDGAVTDAHRRLGELLAAYRHKARLTQVSLGEMVNLSDSAVSKLERGERLSSPDVWDRLGKACNDGGELRRAYDRLVQAEQQASVQRVVDEAEATLERLQAPPVEATVTGVAVPSELVEVLTATVSKFLEIYDRRTVLRAIQLVAKSVTGFELVECCERLVRVIADPERVDAETIEYLTKALRRARREDDQLGPLAVLASMQELRELVRRLLARCRSEWREELLRLYSDVTAAVARYYLDQNEHGTATALFQDARKAAHEAGKPDRAAYALANLSFLSYLQGNVCDALDAASAARNAAAASDDWRIRAICFQMTAAAYALDRHENGCTSAYERAISSLQQALPADLDSPVYWLHRGTVDSGYGSYLVTIGDGKRAAEVAQGALDAFDPTFRAGYVRCLVRSAVALTLIGGVAAEVDEAARRLKEAVSLAARVPSQRLLSELVAPCADLRRRWPRKRTVMELDGELRASGLLVPRSVKLT